MVKLNANCGWCEWRTRLTIPVLQQRRWQSVRRRNGEACDENSSSGVMNSRNRTRRDSKRAPTIRYACIVWIALVATLLSASSARSIESARELSIYCQTVERGIKGSGRHVYIPHTREALTCWGYMQAMQDLSVLADEHGCLPARKNDHGAAHSVVRALRARIPASSRGTLRWRFSELCGKRI